MANTSARLLAERRRAALRVREASQMGFTRCVLADGNCSPDDVPAGIELVGVKTVTEALEQLIDW